MLRQTSAAKERSLHETGNAAVLLDGLRAILLHQRFEQRKVASWRQLPRPALSATLMDLAHNWPAIVSGDNKFHTGGMIAWDIDRALELSFKPAQHHDLALRSALERLALELRLGKSRSF